MSSEGLAEIVPVVDDVEGSARFHDEVVGLAPESPDGDGWAWFWAGEPGRTQRLALREGPLLFEERSPLPEGRRWGRVHYAFVVPPEKLEAAVEHVRGNGVGVCGPTRLDRMRATSYYFYDLDGNLLEFWSPEPGNATKENA